MIRVAYLKVLCPPNTRFDLEGIHKTLENLGFDSVRPEKEYTPNGRKHRLVVWRYNNTDTVPDDEGVKLVGRQGSILYMWTCRNCGDVAQRYEYPENHKNDWHAGCCFHSTT